MSHIFCPWNFHGKMPPKSACTEGKLIITPNNMPISEKSLTNVAGKIPLSASVKDRIQKLDLTKKDTTDLKKKRIKPITFSLDKGGKSLS